MKSTRRQQGAFRKRQSLLQTLVDLELTDDWQHMVDSTVIHAHSQATGAKEGAFGGFWSITRRLYEHTQCPM
ncbi:hypothetical protein AA0521_1469 [Komagataeibacter intermedius NRIC 0521]|uniref:Transposase n=1 Tax=Komagataeibacter intermedius NRIC 0521 TaxID=1307934 RepID=A0ABQ0PHQ3_9PROT|nr:hypothetical protein AA0521_1469 [Komagataeibacter intermedius NRIC 0521]